MVGSSWSEWPLIERATASGTAQNAPSEFRKNRSPMAMSSSLLVAAWPFSRPVSGSIPDPGFFSSGWYTGSASVPPAAGLKTRILMPPERGSPSSF